MWSDLAFRWRALFRRRSVEAELNDELEFHLEQQTEKFRRAGLNAEEAVRRARLEFGGMGPVKEECREARGVSFAETLVRDVKYGLRMLRKSPGFTAAVVTTLAIGIGANTAIFSIVEAVLLRSLPVQDPRQLVVLQWSANGKSKNLGTSSYGDCAEVRSVSGKNAGCSLSYPFFQRVQQQKDLFTGVAAFAGPSEMNVAGNGVANIAEGELVSGDYFRTLGVNAALGRTLQVGDDRAGTTAVAVLDFGYWQRVFGGDASVVGRTVRLNNVLFTVVGVADRSFTRLSPGKAVDVWVPMTQAKPLGIPWGGPTSDANSWWLAVIARLKPGVSRMRAQGAMNSLFANEVLHGAKPIWKTANDPRLTLTPAQDALTGVRQQFGKPLKLLMAAVGIVMLIACANIAGLMLARGTAREKEFAVRLALGAGRMGLVRQLLTESLLLSLLGALAGSVLAYAGAQGLMAFLAGVLRRPIAVDLQLNAFVLLFTIAVVVLTGVGFGLLPALQGTRAAIGVGLKENAPTAKWRSTGMRIFGPANGLVMLQVALSIIVLTGAGLLLRTLEKLRGIDPGFDTRNVLLFSLDPELTGMPSKQIQSLYRDLQQRLAGVPGVDSVSYSSFALLDNSLWTEGIRVPGQTDERETETQMLSVGPAFAKTMRLRLTQGRMFGEADTAAGRSLAVVNQAFVRQFLHGRDAIGMHFADSDAKTGLQWEIVGVVADAKYASLRSAEEPTAYVPMTDGGATFAVRSSADATALTAAIRSVVRQADNQLPVTNVRTQSETIDRLLFLERLLSRLFGLFGVVGMGLACVGLYGLLAYEVSRRTREIGIRRALGAQGRNMLRLVLRRGLSLVVIGAAVGVSVAVALDRLLASLLFQVRSNDPVTFGAVTAALLFVGVMACLLPAQRATQVEPTVALRYE